MDEGKIEEHVDEVYELIGGQLEKEDIRKILRGKMDGNAVAGEKPNLNIEKIALIKKYGGNPEKMRRFDDLTKVENIAFEFPSINILAKVTTIKSRSYQTRDNREGVRYFGFLADDTGSIQFNSWIDLKDVQAGDVLLILNASVRTTQTGNKEVVIGNGTMLHRIDGILENVSSRPSTLTPVKISDIDEGMKYLETSGRVINTRVVDIKEGRKMMVGALVDQNAGIQFTYFFTENCPIEEGKCYRIKGAYARKRYDLVHLTFDDGSTVEELPEEEVKYFPKKTPITSIESLRQGMSWVRVKGRVLELSSRVVSTINGEKTIYTGELGDRTGTIPFSFWTDSVNFSEGDIVDIEGCGVKPRGGLELSISNNSAVTVVEDPSFPEVEFIRNRSERVHTVEDIINQKGGNNVVVQGVVLEVKKNSGLILRCPTCRRPLTGGNCPEHGEVEGERDLRIKGVLDDGTGAMTFLMNRPQTESIIGYNLEEAKKKAMDRGDVAVLKDISGKIQFQPMKLKGNVTVGDGGPMMIVKSYEVLSVDPAEEALELYGELDNPIPGGDAE